MKTPLLLMALRQGLIPLLLAAALHAPVSQAQTISPPNLMSYQGYLTDGSGNPLGSTNTGPKNYNVIFRLWNVQTGGTTTNNELYAEQQTVTVDNGYFSVLLGEGSQYPGEPYTPTISSVFTNSSATKLFVEFVVLGIGPAGANVTIAPRLQLLTSPYAFLTTYATYAANAGNAANANTVVNGAGGTLLTATNGSTLMVNGNVNLGANIITGNGSGLTALNAANLTGSVPPASLTSIPAGNLTGSIADARLSANVALRTGGNSFTGNQTVTSGSVGIGTTTPSNPLSVAGNANFTGNVGIGTTTPSNPLSVAGNANFTGNVGIGTTTPAAPLQVVGNILLGPGGQYQAVAAAAEEAAPLRIVRGNVYWNGSALSVVAGAGYSVIRNGTGDYTITYLTAFSNMPTFTATAYDPSSDAITIQNCSTSSVEIKIGIRSVGWYDEGFQFIAIGPR